MKAQSVNKTIARMVRRIIKRFDPERVILFGSHARGEAGPDSDIDLLVVMPVKGSRREMAIEIGVALHDIRFPKDIIVTTPEEFEWRKDIPGTIERPAAKEGKVLYRRQGTRRRRSNLARRRVRPSTRGGGESHRRKTFGVACRGRALAGASRMSRDLPAERRIRALGR